jgi:hypothetical protein
MSITWAECVCVCVCVCKTLSYPACTVYAPYYIAICGLSGSNRIFPHHLIKARFSEEKKFTEHTLCFDFRYYFSLKRATF